MISQMEFDAVIPDLVLSFGKEFLVLEMYIIQETGRSKPEIDSESN